MYPDKCFALLPTLLAKATEGSWVPPYRLMTFLKRGRCGVISPSLSFFAFS